MDACPRVVIKLCCRNRYRSLSLREARVLSTFPTREGAGNAWAGASSAWETVRGRKASGGSYAGRKSADHHSPRRQSLWVWRTFRDGSPSKEVGAHYAAQAAWCGALTHTDGRHLGLWRARPFTRARRKQPRSLGEGKPFSTQTGLRWRSGDPEGDGCQRRTRIRSVQRGPITLALSARAAEAGNGVVKTPCPSIATGARSWPKRLRCALDQAGRKPRARVQVRQVRLDAEVGRTYRGIERLS